MGGVIIDLGLPEGLDAGLDLLRWIRSRDAVASLRCVVATGQTHASLAWEIPNLHRAEYVPKPLTFAGLASFLEVTDRRRFQAREAIVARATARYALSKRQSEILAFFIEGRGIRAFLLHANIARKTFDTHRDALLAKTGDETVELLVARLVGEALEGTACEAARPTDAPSSTRIS